MNDEPIEIERGSGNVYRDFGMADAELLQARAAVAARIVVALDAGHLSTRDAERLTGVSHAEFSRIRNAQLKRFTLDRLITILRKLDRDTGVEVSFPPRLAEPA